MKAAGLTYESQGTGAVPVVCLHGIGGAAASFADQIGGLSADRQVIAVNLPGYGGSDPLPHPTFETLAQAVLAFLDAIGAGRAHLCGHSIGGMIAIETACRAPDRVASLALIGTTSAFGGRDVSFRDRFIADRLAPLNAGASLADLAVDFVPAITGTAATPDVRAAAVATMAAVPDATYRAIIACLVTFDRRADIARLPHPACLIAGSEDTNAPARTMARMAQTMDPDASARVEFHEIAGAGHLINLETPDETNRILAAFYRRLS